MYRLNINREFTDYEISLWNFKHKWEICPDTVGIVQSRRTDELYSHSQIDEELENYYASDEINYFAKRFKRVLEKEQTYGTYIYNGQSIIVRPLERKYYRLARKLAEEYYIKNDPVMKWCEFEKCRESYNDLRRLFKDWICSGQSVAAVNNTTKQLHGIALCRYNNGTYLSTKISQYQAFEPETIKLLNLKRFYIKRVTKSVKMLNRKYFQIHVLCVDDKLPRYMALAILRDMIAGCESVSRELLCPTVCAISSSEDVESAFAMSGYERVTSCPLYSWLENGEHAAPYDMNDRSPKVCVFVKTLKIRKKSDWKFYGIF